MFNGDLKTASQNLRQNKWRTIFTMLGIIIGITSVVTVVSMGEGLKRQVSGQINTLGSDVITVRPGKLLSSSSADNLNFYALLAPSTLSTQDISAIRNNRVVSAVTPIEFVTNSASSDKGQFDDVFVAGTTPNFPDVLRQKVAYGEFFSEEDDETSDAAIIGSDIAAKMYGLLNPVGETIHILGRDFSVKGVLEPSQGGLLSVAQADYNSSIFLSQPAAERLTAGHTNILQILVRVKKGTNINVAVNSVRASIARNHGGNGDFTVLKQAELLGVSSQILNTLTRFISSIAAISLIVAGIGIMNIMLVSVSERTREIGIRKAIGATNRQILRQFLVEGLVLTVGAGIIGILVSLAINGLLRLYSDWEPVISTGVIVLAVGVAMTAGIIFSLIPALKAARKDPITALRGE